MSLATAMHQAITTRLASVYPAVFEALRSLAVLPPAPNSFSEAAAVAIAGVDVRTVQALAAAGFLSRPAQARYALPKLVATTVSPGDPDTAASRRMVDHFRAYARAHTNEFSVLNAEYSNLIAALSLARSIDPGSFMDMALHLGGLLELRGDYTQLKEVLLQANAVDGRTDRDRAAILLQLARVYEKLGQNQAALETARAGLEMRRTDPALAAPLLAIAGHIEMNQGMLAQAREHLTEGLSLAKTSGSDSACLPFFVSLGVVTTRLGDLEAATGYTEEGIRAARESNNPAILVSLLTNLGVIFFVQNRLDEAVRIEEEGLAIARQIGYSEKEAALLETIGSALVRLGDLDRAETCLKEALSIAERIEHPWYVATIFNSLGKLLLERNHIADAILSFEQAAARSPADTPDVHAYALFGLARALVKSGDFNKARDSALDSIRIFDRMQHRAAADVRKWMQSEAGLEPS